MIGRTLGRYRIVEKLGAGGMGEIYRARDESLARDVAIKMLPPGLEPDDERLRRFTNEARAASALNHPHILTIYEVGSANGAPFIAMELVDGVSLRERLRAGRLASGEALEMARQIAAALSAAHARGLVHRDLKPENVMVRLDGYVKVVDFGLAALSSRPSGATGVSVLETVQAVSGGTPAYMSPEQIEGSAVSAASDVFAFGVLLCELLTGANPFARRTVLETLSAIARTPEPAEAATRPVPEPLRRIILKSLEPDPQRRYASMTHVAADLQSARDEVFRGGEARPARIGVGLLAATMVIAAAAFTAVWFARRTPDAPAPPAQLTHFSTAVRDPAVSPDGKLLVYVVQEPDSPNSQLYAQTLPGGRPRQLTRTPDLKSWPAFSPDGSRIAYTVQGTEWKWDTWVIPVIGGFPELLLRNAAAVQWLPDGRVLFSEFKRGSQLAIVVSDESRSGERDIYVPPANAMAHHSELSPDGSHVVIGQMGGGAGLDNTGAIPLSCFVATFDADLSGRRPIGRSDVPCSMFVRWARDGRHVYFSSGRGSQFQVFRQAMGTGRIEQITTGVGLAVLGVTSSFVLTPDGRSLIYPSGETQEAIWVRRAEGTAAQLTLEGSARNPMATADGSRIVYIFGPRYSEGQIWMRALDGTRAQQLFPGFTATFAAPSGDGARVAFTTSDTHGRMHLWIGAVDNSTAPHELVGADGVQALPLFGPDGRTVFYAERNVGGDTRIWRVNVDGSDRRAISDVDTALQPLSVSPDGRWISAIRGGRTPRETWIFPTDGSRRGRKLWNGWALKWAPGNHAFLLSAGGMVSTAWLLPNPTGASMPPDLGENPTEADLSHAGGRSVMTEYFFVDPTPTPPPYAIAYSKAVNRSNLYQLQLPR